MTQVTDRSVRARMAGAAARLRRLERIDRAAVFVISLGGFAVVISVLGILVFIALEAVPLFRPARVTAGGPLALETPLPAASGLRALGVDEYRQYLFAIEPDAHVVFYRLPSGGTAAGARLQPSFSLPIPGLDPGAPIASSSRSLLGSTWPPPRATAAWP